MPVRGSRLAGRFRRRFPRTAGSLPDAPEAAPEAGEAPASQLAAPSAGASRRSAARSCERIRDGRSARIGGCARRPDRGRSSIGCSQGNAVPAERARPFDVPAIRQDFPDPAPAGPRQAAGLARQRRHDPETAERDRRRVAFLRPRQLEHPSRGPYPGGPGDRRLRAGAAEGAGLPGRFVGQGNHLCPRHHRRHQPRRPDLWPEVPAAGRRDRAFHARTPRQHRALANGCQGEGRRDAGHPGDRPRRRSCSNSIRRCSGREPGWSRWRRRRTAWARSCRSPK